MSQTVGSDLASLLLDVLLMQRRSLPRKLSTRGNLQLIRIAVLGGSTTNEVVSLLSLWLLEGGFSTALYQSQYGRYYVDAVHDTQAVIDFAALSTCSSPTNG